MGSPDLPHRIQGVAATGESTEHGRAVGRSADRAADRCIHVPGRAWLFVEAKFGSPTTTKKTDAARDAWLERYERTCPEDSSTGMRYGKRRRACSPSSFYATSLLG